jgi:hypothetical protein
MSTTEVEAYRLNLQIDAADMGSLIPKLRSGIFLYTEGKPKYLSPPKFSYKIHTVLSTQNIIHHSHHSTFPGNALRHFH